MVSNWLGHLTGNGIVISVVRAQSSHLYRQCPLTGKANASHCKGIGASLVKAQVSKLIWLIAVLQEPIN